MVGEGDIGDLVGQGGVVFEQLAAGDRLLLSDTAERLKEYEQMLGASLYSGGQPVDDDNPLHADDQQLAEVVVVQGSPLQGTTLSASRFADAYQLLTLALHRIIFIEIATWPTLLTEQRAFTIA